MTSQAADVAAQPMEIAAPWFGIHRCWSLEDNEDIRELVSHQLRRMGVLVSRRGETASARSTLRSLNDRLWC